MRRAFLDSNVFLHALGREHACREPCRRIVSALATGESTAETSVGVLQEVVHVRRRGVGELEEAVQRVRNILALGLPVHDLRREDFELALDLQLAHRSLSSRDAIHLATMQNRGIDLIISADRHFDQVEAIQRLDPLDPAALTALDE